MNTISYTYERPTPYTSDFLQALTETPHVIIGGCVGSGKSVLIDNIIYYILKNRTPNNTGLILIDPKRVSLAKYKNLPFTDIYADNNRDIIQALKNTINLMDNIYLEMQAKNIYQSDGAHYYIIIDELADLLTTCKKDVLPLLQRIAQLGRASNIHLICATQSPSRLILSAQLTLNFTGRVGLRCATSIESKQILNGFTGAEKLPRYGKCIYNENGYLNEYEINKLNDDDINEIINFWLVQCDGQNVAPDEHETPQKKRIYLPSGFIGLFIGSLLSFTVWIWIIKTLIWIFTP